METLALTTSSYSKEVLTAAINQKAFTAEQAKAILMAKGIEEAEIDEILVRTGLNTATTASTVAVNLNTMSKIGNTAATQAQISEETKNLLLKGNLITAEQIQAGTTVELTKAKIADAVATGSLTKAEGEQLITTLGLTGATGGLGTAFKGLALSLKSAAASALTFLTTDPLGWLLLAAAGVAGVAAAYNALTISLEEQKEKLSNSEDAYKETANALSELENEIQTNIDKKKELESVKTPTWVDQEELERLREVTKELELQKLLKQDEQLMAAENLYKENKATYEMEFAGVNGYSAAVVTDALSNGDIGVAHLNLEDNITDMIAAIHYLEEEKSKLTDLDDIAGYDLYIEQITSQIKKSGTDYLTSLTSYKQNMLEIASVRDLSPEEQAFYDNLSSMQKMIYEFYSPATWNNLEMDSIFDTKGIEKTKEELIALSNAGKLTPEIIKENFPELNQAIEGSELFLEKGETAAQAFCDEIKACAEAESEFDNPNDSGIQTYETLTASAAEAAKSVSALQSAISTLNEALEEQDKNGSISVSTMLALTKAGYATALQFDDTTGACTINKDAMLELAEAKIQNQIQDLEYLRTSIAEKLVAEELIAEESAGTFIKLAEAKAKAATAEQLSYVQNYNEASAQIKALENYRKNLYKAGSDNSSGSKSTGSSSAPLKDAFTQEYNTLKHNLEMEYLTQKQYFDSLEALNNKYFAGKTEYLDDCRKYEEEIYKGLQSFYKDNVESQINLLEKQLDAGVIHYRHYSSTVKSLLDSMYTEGKLTASDYHAYIQQMLEKQKDIYDRALSAVTARLDREIDSYGRLIEDVEKQNDALETQKETMENASQAVADYYQSLSQGQQHIIDGLEDKNDTLNSQLSDYDKILSAIDRVYDTEQNALTLQKDALQEKIDLLNDNNSALDLQYRKEQALSELQKSQSQRTRKVLTQNGFTYRTDAGAVRENQKTLNDIQNEELITKLETEQTALQDSIDSLQEYRDNWNKVADVWNASQEDRLLTELFGETASSRILQNRPEDLEGFRNRYLSASQQINDNTALIASIQEKLEQYAAEQEAWSALTNAIQDNVNRQAAVQLLGADWETQINEGRFLAYDTFQTGYLGIQARLNDNTALIASYNEKITYYDNLKTQWGEISNAYEESADSQYASMLLGQSWEKDVLSGRLETLNAFKNDYLSIQQAIADAAWASANEQINAAKEAAKAQDGTAGTAGNAGTVGSSADSSNTASEKNNRKYEVLYEGSPAQALKTFDTMEAAQSYADNRSQGIGENDPSYYVRTVPKYHAGLKEGPVESSLKTMNFRLLEKIGLKQDEVPAILKKQEAVLTEEQIDNIAQFLRATPVMPIMPDIRIPDKSFFTNLPDRDSAQPLSLNIGEIHLHNVQNTDSFADAIIREFPNKMLQAMHRRH